ncbi:MAG TPA: helix-turn-helix domain-containing protein [Chryseolinea sp.]|nr:helix-turn-helix domain-containing protein [Chryseolinea sp.]HPH45712.1 helix-turn-helix domain-containing protein [Chryseolinea sp.]HPM29734.1 helix-turn-helix domain-containing protein [Chryseolinea sp.]
MNYQTFQPHSDLASLVKCFWTLEVPAEEGSQRQRIVPDGCLEMIFILGDNIKRIVSEDEFIIQERAMVVGQITEPFLIEPTGYVNVFATRFYPYGFAYFIAEPIKNLTNKETSIELLFGEEIAKELQQKIVHASSTEERIEIMETFLLSNLRNEATIDNIVKTTIDALLSSKGNAPIGTISENDLAKRRQLERRFLKQIGLSPKQLGKVIRMQTALKLLLNQKTESLTEIAYESEYYDQAHFIKDFKEFTGTNPGEFIDNKNMVLSSLFYTKD